MSGGWVKHRNKVVFCGAHLLSAFGYEFAFFVMTLHVYGRQGSAADVAVFSALTFLPRLFAPMLGSLVDRHPKEKLFAMTLVLGALLATLVPFTRWELIPWTGVAVLSVLFSNVRTVLMTRILGGGGYLKGNAAMLLSLNAAKLAAPLAGAVAAACLPFHGAMSGAGIVFLLAAVCSWSVNVTEEKAERERDHGPLSGSFQKGFAELWRIGQLRFIFLLSLAWRIFLGLQISLFVVFIKKSLGGNDSDYGLFMTCLGLGSLAGSLAGPWIARRMPHALLAKAGMGLHFATFVLLGWTTTVAAAAAVAVAGSVILYATAVGVHSLRDQAVPGGFRGRVFGANTAILSLAVMISMLAGGPLADAYGVNLVFAGAGALSLVSLVTLNVLFRPFDAAPEPEMVRTEETEVP